HPGLDRLERGPDRGRPQPAFTETGAARRMTCAPAIQPTPRTSSATTRARTTRPERSTGTWQGSFRERMGSLSHRTTRRVDPWAKGPTLVIRFPEPDLASDAGGVLANQEGGPDGLSR